MYRARNIKMLMFINFIGAISWYILAIILFRDASKYYNNGYYYWSSGIRDAASKLTMGGLLFLFGGSVQLALGFSAAVLKNIGKVCPDCERVFLSSINVCTKCKTDLTYAKSVKEYVAVKPKIIPKGIQNISSVSPMVGQQNGNKRFCAYCGKELSVRAAFCQQCGNKVN